MATTMPMLAPDGTSGEIPVNRIADALKAGFKQAVPMIAPTGESGWIPTDQVSAAKAKGFDDSPQALIQAQQKLYGAGNKNASPVYNYLVHSGVAKVNSDRSLSPADQMSAQPSWGERALALVRHPLNSLENAAQPVSRPAGASTGEMAAADANNVAAGVTSVVRHPIDTAIGMVKAPIAVVLHPQETYEALNQGGPEAGAYMIGQGLATAGLAKGVLPVAGPVASAAARGIGKGLQSAGEGLAESALGVRNTDRAFDANPGRAALTQTTGFKPSDIADEAQQRLTDLALERAQLAHDNPGPVDFSPARHVASDAMQEQALRNAMPQIDRMAPLAEQILTQGEPRGGWPIGVRPLRAAGKPIPPYVETPEALNLREGVGSYAADKPWTGKASADPLRGMVRGMYGSMSDSIHSAVPEIEPVDAQMHDLIPVAQRAGEIDLNASTLQRVAGRFARPTGALVGSVSGAAAGHAAAGSAGAIAGGLLGLITPEVLADPGVQMAVARALYNTGRAVEPAAPAAAAVAPASAANLLIPAASAASRTGPLGQPNFYSDEYLRSKAAFDAWKNAQNAQDKK